MQSKKIKLIGHNPSGNTFPAGTLFVKSRPSRIFLLSPANVAGLRGKLVLADSAHFSLAQRLRSDGVALGEIFTFISGLYFRGKLAYARAYANPLASLPGVVVITASGGLVSPDKLLTLDELRRIACNKIDVEEKKYRVPLERDARLLRDNLSRGCEIVLLGSIATPKYVEPLLGIFGERLLFPSEFVGRGDMSRGGLLLRCLREQVELKYVPVYGTVRNGTRPAKLPRLTARAQRTGHFEQSSETPDLARRWKR